ncbi:MAG TPA: hypothetical protein VH083_13060 [Myxococcales bacterium]|jgi:hypothetical protein|nr:hypothetical protein [Myxococcales bacterium]
MSLFVSVGGLFRQQPGTTVTWTTSFGAFGQDRRIVIQAPNIQDDILGSVRLEVVSQSVVASSDNSLSYLVTIRNPGSQAVSYNLNIQDPL